ncbi:patj homolog isoform X2 [Chelonus insularis]|uniref:patj homolog isoform X2 n=1 Tax=Chelonus insularis TaxID=460826 RepID=UPI0015897B2C|nr:patj homolog isoform X2 [Chelonus insularis]
MSLAADISTALHLLVHIHNRVKDNDKLEFHLHTSDDVSLLISLLEEPLFRSIVVIQDSLIDLNTQLIQHPSILPGDFDINLIGQLELSIPTPPIKSSEINAYQDLYNDNSELDDQRVPVASVIHTSSEDNSTQLNTSGLLSEGLNVLPITTPTYVKEFQKVIETAANGREILTVQLCKPEGNNLGFSVVGLRSKEKGDLGIFLQEIQPNSIAGRDGRLVEGDQILAIDGQPLDSNISHEQAISILQQARGVVEIVIARNNQDYTGQSDDTSEASTILASDPCILLESNETKTALELESTVRSYLHDLSTTKDTHSTPHYSLLPLSEASGVERSPSALSETSRSSVDMVDNRLQSGDHILQIGDVNLRGMGSEQVAAVLRQSGTHVRLVVARPVEPMSPDYQMIENYTLIVPTKILSDSEELDRYLIQKLPGNCNLTSNENVSNNDTNTMEHDSDPYMKTGFIIDIVQNPASSGLTSAITTSEFTSRFNSSTYLPDSADTNLCPEMERFTVELKKDIYGLGITIAGYVCEQEELSGIFIKSISKGSAADLSNKVQVNDRIIEVNNHPLKGYSNHEAVEVLKNTGQIVTLCMERYLRGPKYEQLQQAIAASELKKPQPASPSIMSLPSFPISTDGDTILGTDYGEEDETCTFDKSTILDNDKNRLLLENSPNHFVIEDVSCDPMINLNPTTKTTIEKKWKDILDDDTEIIIAQLKKFSEDGGLGISLEGTVDVENGQEVRPHHYIRSILPEGPVGKDGTLRSGDELLEVNGMKLLGINHKDVVAILKDLPMNVRIVCGRNSTSQIILCPINTAQHPAAFQTRNISHDLSVQSMNVMDKLVKAKSDESLASTNMSDSMNDVTMKAKSRSLEPLTNFAMWSTEYQEIKLKKGERGLGFSILDYQDPVNPKKTVIVIRSLVPGGVAQIDGQIIPGDRLISVNDVILENSTLDQAVQVLKNAAKGTVKIGVAKPLSIPDNIINNHRINIKKQANDSYSYLKHNNYHYRNFVYD